MMSIATSRLLLSALLGLILAGCTATASSVARSAQSQPSVPVSITNYRTQVDEKFPVPAVDTEKLKTRNMRQLVDYPTNHPPGTLVVDTKHRFVYLVQEGGKALRYGVGVGREGVEFTGSATVGLKREWPRWTPTPDMIKREPERYAQWADGMQGGPQNPLGARALYLYKDGKDTLFRIHGTNEPESIGHAVSSGCIRMMNQDVIDLYQRVPPGSRVVVE